MVEIELFHKDILIIESILQMPIKKIPVKMFLIKIKESVLLISPLPDLDKYEKQIKSFGNITDIIAPNTFHNLGILAATKLFPSARLWGVKGLEKKVKEVSWDEIMPSDNWPFSNELLLLPIEGMPLFNEITFYHKDSKSLIVMDLCFNELDSNGFGSFIFGKLAGTYKKFAVSSLFKLFIKDKDKFKKSIHMVLENPFENILLPHGHNITANGHEQLTLALQSKKLI